MSMQINDLPKPLQDQIKRDEFQDQKTLEEQKQILYERLKELKKKRLDEYEKIIKEKTESKTKNHPSNLRPIGYTILNHDGTDVEESGEGSFHGFFVDVSGGVIAVIEREDGFNITVDATMTWFLDR